MHGNFFPFLITDSCKANGNLVDNSAESGIYSDTELYRAVKTDPGQPATDGVIQAIESLAGTAGQLG